MKLVTTSIVDIHTDGGPVSSAPALQRIAAGVAPTKALRFNALSRVADMSADAAEGALRLSFDDPSTRTTHNEGA